MLEKNNLKSFIEKFNGGKIVIWGLGLNFGGLTAVDFFCRNFKKSEVVVIDLKNEKELKESLRKIRKFKNLKIILGRQDFKDFKGASLVIKNPAIPWENDLVKKLQKEGISLETDITLFFKFFKGKVVGITGSKGKTTTTTLIGKIIKDAGLDVFMGGNIRVSMFSYFKKNILENSKKIAVLELSSFQLEDLAFVKISPNVSVLTNVLRDHLNRYGTKSKYLKAKKNIALFQKKRDFLILNKDDVSSIEFQKGVESFKLFFSKTKLFDESGIYLGLRPNQYFLKNKHKIKKIIIKNIFFQHPHNAQSLAMAALVCFLVLKISLKSILRSIEKFKGVPYRMEKIRTVRGVTFYNDTTATIPDATLGNLELFSQKIILITGGSDKNLKFDLFGKKVARKAKMVVLLPGNITGVIKEKIQKNNSSISCLDVKNMREGVCEAFKNSKKGDVILLSPGCTSFGLFKNEFDRGDQFNEEVRKL